MLIGSIGLAGALILVAVVLAAVFAGGLFWWRSRAVADDSQIPDDLHIV